MSVAETTAPAVAVRRALRPLPAPRGHVPGRVARRVILRALAGITRGRLHVRLPGGEERSFGPGGEEARLEIARDDFFRRLALRGRIGFGEAYVAGDWDSPDVVGLLALLARNVEEARERPPLQTLLRVSAHRPRLPARAGRARAARDVGYHYDLGNDLYRLFLDESLTYSCAYFEHPGQSLEDAQQAKYRRICEKLALTADDHVLEIGCGWGGFAIHAAREHGVRVTGVTISREQHELARRRVAEAGLSDRIEIAFRDFRDLGGRYSRIASIEMLEAIGESQLPVFFAACDRLLEPGGVACIQTIAVPDQRYDAYRRQRDFIQAYIFPGGFLPSVTALTTAMTASSRLVLHGLEEIGPCYADTLAEWRRRFNARLDDVRALGYDARFERTWDYYLAFCEAGFRTRALRDVQLVLTRPLNESLPAHPRPRPTF